MVDSRHAYPTADKCEIVPTRMHLSTGKAFIRRQVDCWMTFEEYDNLTKLVLYRDQNEFRPKKSESVYKC